MKRRILTRRRLMLTVLCASGMLALYLGLLIFPGACFAYEYKYDHIVVHSDEPIPASAAVVLEEATMRLARSPLSAILNQPGRERRIYVCNRPWRFLLFANFRFRVAGLTYAPITNNIFVRAVRFDANRLVSPSGVDVPGDRTLSYFLAHEITHTLVADHLGAFGYWRLPIWRTKATPTTSAKAQRSTTAMLYADCKTGHLKWIPSGRDNILVITCLWPTCWMRKVSALKSFFEPRSMPMSREILLLRQLSRDVIDVSLKRDSPRLLKFGPG